MTDRLNYVSEPIDAASMGKASLAFKYTKSETADKADESRWINGLEGGTAERGGREGHIEA